MNMWGGNKSKNNCSEIIGERCRMYITAACTDEKYRTTNEDRQTFIKNITKQNFIHLLDYDGDGGQFNNPPLQIGAVPRAQGYYPYNGIASNRQERHDSLASSEMAVMVIARACIQ
jgi:hypothetical protein